MVVCFDTGLVRVAQSAKVRVRVVVRAGNDQRAITTGVEKGHQAAEALGCGAIYADGIASTDLANALKEWVSPARVRLGVLRGANYLGQPP